MKKIITKSILVMFLLIVSMTSVLAFADSVETLPPSYIGYDTATFSGNLTVLNSDNGTASFEYKKSGDVDWISIPYAIFLDSTGEFSLNATDETTYLEPDTNYTYRAIFMSDVTIESLNEENFTTNKSPSVDYDSTSDVSDTGFTYNLEVTDLGDEDNISVYLFCLGDTIINTSDSAITVNETGTESITVTGLGPNEEYSCLGVIEWDFGGETQTSFLDEVLITTADDSLESGINNVQRLTFLGFALLALILLFTAAMTLIALMNDNADIGQLMMVSIFIIGGAIVLFVGYVIISAVAGGLL